MDYHITHEQPLAATVQESGSPTTGLLPAAPGQVVAAPVDYSNERLEITQIQHNSTCKPRTINDKPQPQPCTTAMTTWWVVRDSRGRVLYAGKTKEEASAWVVQRRELAKPVQTVEPTNMETPRPGFATHTTETTTQNKTKTDTGKILLFGGAAIAALLLMK